MFGYRVCIGGTRVDLENCIRRWSVEATGATWGDSKYAHKRRLKYLTITYLTFYLDYIMCKNNKYFE